LVEGVVVLMVMAMAMAMVVDGDRPVRGIYHSILSLCY
jgi:hypothetical protein